MKKLTLSRMKIVGIVILILYYAFLIIYNVNQFGEANIPVEPTVEPTTVPPIIDSNDAPAFLGFPIILGVMLGSLVLSFAIFYIIGTLKARKEKEV